MEPDAKKVQGFTDYPIPKTKGLFTLHKKPTKFKPV